MWSSPLATSLTDPSTLGFRRAGPKRPSPTRAGSPRPSQMAQDFGHSGEQEMDTWVIQKHPIYQIHCSPYQNQFNFNTECYSDWPGCSVRHVLRLRGRQMVQRPEAHPQGLRAMHKHPGWWDGGIVRLVYFEESTYWMQISRKYVVFIGKQSNVLLWYSVKLLNRIPSTVCMGSGCSCL